MDKTSTWIPIITLVFLLLIISSASATTDASDVSALQDLYRTLSFPPQLTGWKTKGGDPCGELWKGVSCDGSSILYIKLNGLDLGGYLGEQLNLMNLKQLDLSSNHIQGAIPSLLPPNATNIDLSCNDLNMSIPYTLTSMKHLRHLNFSHNALSGPIGNVFTGLHNLKQMDLSFNNFTGDLPSSFGNLTNLTGLYLQNNKFTGSVIFLANLPLTELNIQNNHFSGVVPKQFQYVPNLWIGGNAFQIGGDYPPWNFPEDTIPSDQNINSPPATESNAIENYPSLGAGEHQQKRFSPAVIACAVGGVALVATCAAFIIAIHIKRSRVNSLQDLEDDDNSLPVSTHIDYAFDTPDEFPQSLASRSPPVLVLRRIPSVRHGTPETSNIRKSFSKRSRIPVTAKSYTVAELQSATNSFSEENLLGQGSLGSVFKAEFPDGQVLAVKNICTVALSIHEEEQFLDVVSNVARLRHPNIITLVGYCMEHGQHLLVYQYVRNWSLENALHHNAHKHLNWTARIRIALGLARALDYLHSACFPPVAHCNLKAANILLDDELMPRLCDCGLAVLRPLTSNSIKVKASELAIGCTGYTAPENSQPGIDKLKSDVYAFGVLLLELLTGRKPFDSSKPRQEQSLVKWALSCLHDYDSLEGMVDPTAKVMFSSRSLSRFADIVILCTQTEPEFRPTMSEIVQCLELLNERSSVDGYEGDTFDMSFQTTRTGLIGSPVTSYASV
ncbi:hypothetical protein AQUCO_00900159v1 [Aquilegia coerulea]|uniref:Protein kinase domain-containing protein n=1 Tax=Aquilegia coerulea TaxID=218851 RepID=A0A2G5ECC8_AQUCA|nr:hypothetical protein AQUCO_00900159v1 [Aquilegia coerulea]PIA53386.1 hypothetical protein AQUCO_00900159v1 [Aquilegia coerulea]